jgi:hypothetical protein
MDGRDELRAALQRRRAEDKSASREQSELDQKREAYERDEEEARDHLRAAATAATEAIISAGQPGFIEFGPKPTGPSRLFGADNRVEGWRVSLGPGDDSVLRPDGTLIPWGTTPPSTSNRGLKLTTWVDWKLRDVRTDPNGEGVPINLFSEAFQRDDRVGARGNILREESLRQRLNHTRGLVLSVLADILQSAEVDV